jgi:hypothetical protein
MGLASCVTLQSYGTRQRAQFRIVGLGHAIDDPTGEMVPVVEMVIAQFRGGLTLDECDTITEAAAKLRKELGK